MKPFHILAVAAGLAFSLSATTIRAQFEDIKTPGARLDKTIVEKIKIGAMSRIVIRSLPGHG